MTRPIPDNIHCDCCKARYCRNKELKDFEKDRDLVREVEAISQLSSIWNIPLKQTIFKYCPHDFYCTSINLIGDITCPNSKWMDALKFATPGWVVKYCKMSTLLNSYGSGILAYYVWMFSDGQIKVLSAWDMSKHTPDTMYDKRTTEMGLNGRPEHPQMRRSDGVYINPIRMQDPEYYLDEIRDLLAHFEHNRMVEEDI
jgi:hypothetical protein